MPAEYRDPLPAAADLVVIGGGIAGVMAAWFAAGAGLRVVLVEKGRVAAEQSSRNWGWIRAQGRDPAELPIMAEAAALWPLLQRETGEDLGLARTGTLYLARRDRDLARHEAWMVHARAHGLDTRMLTARAVARLLPGAAEDWHGGLYTPSDLRAEPWVAVPALARAARASGVAIREGCAARRLDMAGGRIAGVVTEAGRIAAPRVVLAGGAWSALFLRAHGIGLPQLSVRATALATAPLPQVHAGGACDDRLAFRRRQDGGYTLAPNDRHDFHIGPDALRHARAYWPQIRDDPRGTIFRAAAPRDHPDAWRTPRRWDADEITPFERARILDPAPNMALVRRARARFEAAFPRLGPVRIARAWAGMIDTLPDMLPVIDRVAALPGLVVLTGLSGHGFGIGPGVGRVAADLAMDRAPGHDLTPFALDRFGT
ncbi:FAD dependent oxidoreductase [Oceaniovalibus guishaninsula JLT2003]|uniref:FAD dependent oxidoreductase n=1 Tax=Oceaniovalibus guishaninsula JLT2003 TaxID=1231392 RepID=K2H9V3_9RHOB|nr:FAD-binding oxidoreductase [Oceaniovalibus guishaninsula]EKE44328.1 FAD dependent oxidoreductase [Oceaniovalibus guishaninsula JLT2003]